MEYREMLRAVRGLLDRAGVQAYSRAGQPLSTKERVHEVLVHVDELGDRIRELSAPARAPQVETTPIPMRLPCPACGELHIDVAFADRPHHTHACQHCGNVWRPALVPTVGVRFLPGFRDEPSQMGVSNVKPAGE